MAIRLLSTNIQRTSLTSNEFSHLPNPRGLAFVTLDLVCRTELLEESTRLTSSVGMLFNPMVCFSSLICCS